MSKAASFLVYESLYGEKRCAAISDRIDDLPGLSDEQVSQILDTGKEPDEVLEMLNQAASTIDS